MVFHQAAEPNGKEKSEARQALRQASGIYFHPLPSNGMAFNKLEMNKQNTNILPNVDLTLFNRAIQLQILYSQV